MASKGNFFSKFLAFVLVLIIISGVGFLGYSLLSGHSGGMNMDSMATGTDTTTSANNSASHSKTTTTNSSSKDTMNMGSTANTQYATDVINAVLQNKDSIEKTIATLNDSLKLMTLDPYGVETKQESNMNSTVTQPQQNSGQNQTPANGTGTQGGTIVNIYPQNGTSQVTTMQSMGTTYDAAKMENLHTGLYKVSVGMQLLDQLKNNLSVQLEQASMEVKEPSQYYYNQYLVTMQNKTKLTEALTYINEATSLVNINPYVSQNGAVYDKERMSNIHDSIYKLAQVVVDLNKLNDNFSKQAIFLGTTTQNYINSSQSMNMNGTGINFFGNINLVTVFNILVVVFIIIFVISILGYISRLLKSPKNID